MSRPSCLAQAELLSAALGESMPALAQEHLAVCASCVRRLRRLTAEVAALRRIATALPELPSPTPLAPSPDRLV
ncbi:MAG TPA: hypothetical protein VH682_31970 [Gemmataceae bacterium]|jgi:hypothetical protein